MKKQMKPNFLTLLVALGLCSTGAQAQRLQQQLGRGVVVVSRTGTSRTGQGGSGALVSWRKLAQEPEGTTYNLYRRTKGASTYTKVNTAPLTQTNYSLATSALQPNTEFAVAAVVNGTEGELSHPFLYQSRAWDNVWFDFDFDDKVIRRNDYRTKFVWPMDLDGNGEVDAVLCDRLFAGAASNDDAESLADNTATTSHKIQAYRLDGTLLWTVDMGPNVNICGGQNDMVVAYDINCDGRCEVIIRSSDGTRFWDKAKETWGKSAMGSDVADVDGDGIVDYRTQSRRNRPFYVSVIDGATGAELACSELDYSAVHDGADAYTRDNRSSYMSDSYSAMDGHFSICYLDGIHPSVVMECLDRDNNKTHHNYVFSWGYDWTNGVPSRWHQTATWSRNDKKPWPAEFHQLRVADMDGDGRDEMVQGGYSLNPLTGFFRSPGIGHGDRYIVSDIDPDRPGMEVYAIQQSALLGQLLYDAATGERIKEWYLPSVYDVGRGACMDIDPKHKGYEIYSFTDDYIYDCKGDATGETRSGHGISTMFEGFWWDGDLLREELSSPGGSGWGTNLMVTTVLGKSRLIEFSRESNWGSMGATGTRPAFMGDIVGDWREEVILAKQNADSSTGLVGYSTNLPTNYSIYCLQQDPHYRGDCTTRGYYQHPNTSFYLGTGMPLPPVPPMMQTDVRYRSGSWAAGATGFTSYDQTQAQAYADGQSVLFDLSGDHSRAVEITDEVHPAATYFMSPKGADYVLNGTIGGEGIVVKSQQGTTTLNGALKTKGQTLVSEGTLAVNGTVAGPLELRARGTLAGNAVLEGDITFEGALNYEGCRLSPGTAESPFGTLTFNRNLALPGDVFVELNLQTEGTAQCDLLQVNGDLTLQKTNTLTIVPSEAVPAAGEYVLMQCTGTLTADVQRIKVRGLVGLNYALEVRDQQLVLIVRGMREAAANVYWSGSESGDWDYQSSNFVLDGEPTAFVANDGVVFSDEAAQRVVNLTDKMVTSSVLFTHDTGTYTFNGEGGFSGEGSLVKNGEGALVLNATKSDYTGRTVLNSGTVTVKNMENAGTESCFGAGSIIQIGKATLTIDHTNSATDRRISLTDTATINIPTGSASLKSPLTGTGVLVKKGNGQLNLNYGGSNGYAGTILQAGTLSQGAWNATLGKVGSPIYVTGNATIRIFNNNSTSAVPSINNVITIEKGKTLTVAAGQRCRMQGSLKGEGTLKISYPYVRGDFEANCSAFEGTLNPTSGQFRISTTLNLAKGTLELGSGVYAAHVKGQSGTEESRAARIGSLKSTATDCSLSTGTWNVGYLGNNDTYAGTFNGNATLNKYGEGTLTLTGASAGALNVYEGMVWANCSSASTTSGLITVRDGGTLKGNGQVQNVTVKQGGTLGVLYRTPTLNTMVGTLTVNGNLTAEAGAIIQIRTRTTATKTSSDVIAVKGKTTLTSPIIEMSELNANYSYKPDQDIQIFKCTGTLTIKGDAVILPEVPKAGYIWDTTSLATEGIIRVVEDPAAVGISNISADGLTADDVVYDLAGRRLHTIAQSGCYIVNGKKVYIRK